MALAPNAFALTIDDDSTGGDCNTVGTWNPSTRTCTLSMDVNEGIVMGANAITLDGNDHIVTAPVPGVGNGVSIQIMFGITIENLQLLILEMVFFWIMPWIIF